jgi:hypothetical protein
MIAAIYARKSTEQNGVADEQKSVARQIEQAGADPLALVELAATWKAQFIEKGWST